MISKVKKSSGITEEFQLHKIRKIVDHSCEGTEADPQAVIDAVLPTLVDNMSTDEIQAQVVKAAVNLIDKDTPDYQYVAARLTMYGLRKKVYGQIDPPSFYNHVKRLVDIGVYDSDLTKKYTKEDFDILETVLNHDRDYDFTYAGAMQFKEKYLVKDRSAGVIYETPQFAYMLIAMGLHQEEKHRRLEYVRDFYNAVSEFKISLPTPILAGVRTPTRQFSSCVKIESGDSLESIGVTGSAILKYISQRAGLGINGGAIRAEGSKIRNGEVVHTGVIPFWKYFQTAVKSCSQGGIRGGSGNVNYPIWHLEVEKLLVLKNNKGTEETRIRHLDYTVHLNKFLLQRYKENGYITLFSPDVDGGRLYEDFYKADQSHFQKRYEALEMNHVIRKKRIKAVELINMMMTERANTSRIYTMFVDNVNKQTPYKEPIRMSNLCVEINLPTYPMGTRDEEIALCTLAAYNLGKIKNTTEYLALARILVRALDNLLDYQDYPVPAAEKAKKRRALGIGSVNLAYLLAKNFVTYNDKAALALVHEHYEAMQFANIQASMELAKERGANEWHDRTKWADGLLPIDWYNRNVDELTPHVLKQDWEWLRIEIAKYGMRNDTLSAQMPSESSSQLLNATNGVEPVRALLSVKASKEGAFNQLVPDVDLIGDEYQTAWQMIRENGMTGYLSICAVIQKFFDQGISVNTYYSPTEYIDGKLPMKVMIKDLFFAQRYGLKSLYYHNTRDASDADVEYVKEADCVTCSI